MNQYSEKYVDQLEVQIAEQQAEIETMRKDYMILAGKYQDALLELKFGKAQEK